MNQYRKLCNDSIELIQANKQIEKLNAMIKKKEEKIEMLNEKLKQKKENSKLSPVSRIFYNI